MTGSTVSVFPFRNRVSSTEAFEGLELGEGKPSRPVLRGPGGRKAAWPLGNYGDSANNRSSSPGQRGNRRSTSPNVSRNFGRISRDSTESLLMVRLPQFDFVAVGIIYPGEAAVAFVLALRVDVNAFFR